MNWAQLARFLPFLNEDYEKIRQNAAFWTEGPLWHKLFQPESGYEVSYFRPIHNLILSVLVRVFGVDEAWPFRLFGAFLFGACTVALYFLARYLKLSRGVALCGAAFFAFHPFNSWFYFHGVGVGNSLAILLAAAVWPVFDKAMQTHARRVPAYAFLVFLLVYLSAASKDTGILMVGALLPAVLFSRRSAAFRRWFLWAAALAGALLFVWHRQSVLHADPRLDKVDIPYTLAHSGWLFLNYLGGLFTASNLTYGAIVPEGPGWSLTAGMLALFFVTLWRLRRLPEECALFWAMGIFALESVIASFPSFWIFPTRVAFFMAAGVLFAGKLWQRYAPSLSPRVRLAFRCVLWSAFVWCFLMSALHVASSLDEQWFYRFHNARPYSWKLLYVEARRHEARGEWSAAERAYRASLGLFRTTSTHVRLGFTLSAQGRVAESASCFLEALGLNPWHLKATRYLADALEKKPDLLEQEGFWLLADGRLKEKALVYNNVGTLLAERGYRRAASILFVRAVHADPAFEPPHHNLALLLRESLPK